MYWTGDWPRLAIVTKDEDFVTLRTLNPEGPAVVWVRIGNTTRRALLAKLEPLFSDVEEALDAGERLVEVV